MKFNWQPIVSGFRGILAWNNNGQSIEDAFQNTISRDGSTPNDMEANLDLGLHRIINVGAPIAATDAVRLMDLTGIDSGDLEAIGITQTITNGDTLHAPSGDAVYDALALKANLADVGSIALATTIVDGDTTHAPTGNAVFDGLALKADLTVTDALATQIGNVVTSSITNGDTTHAPSGDAVFDAIAALNSGSYEGFVTLKSYGSVEDGVTDDKAAFDAALADADAKVIWIGGNTYTTNTIASLNKKFVGPGKIGLSVSSKQLPSNWTGITSLPTQGTGADTNYFHSGDNSRVDTQYYRLGEPGGANFRQNLNTPITGGFFPYFESTTTPHFWTLQNYVGWSGINCQTTTLITSGVETSCTVNNASHGISTGDEVGFITSAGVVGDKRIVTVAGANLSWTGALTNTYAISTAVTKGYRTMNPLSYYQMSHRSGGDAYANVARADCSYVPLASQIHWVETATVGLYGGDIALTTDGVYGTGTEIQISDQGTDVCGIGDVRSYTRTNDTGARGCGWIGSFSQSTGTKPINAFHVIAGIADVGYDASQGVFGATQAAFQMATNHRIIFDSSGSSALTTKMGDPKYSQLYGNSIGNSYLHHKANGGLDSRGKRIETVVNGALTSAGYGSFNVRGSDVEFHQPLKGFRTNGTTAFSFEPASTGLYFADAAGSDTSVSVSRVGGTLVLSSSSWNVVKDAFGLNVGVGHLVGLGNDSSDFTGLYWNGTTITLYKAGSPVATW